MAPTKVSDTDLRAYLDAGHSQAEAARHFGVSEPAIHQRLKRMRTLTSQVVALEKAGSISRCVPRRRVIELESLAAGTPCTGRIASPLLSATSGFCCGTDSDSRHGGTSRLCV